MRPGRGRKEKLLYFTKLQSSGYGELSLNAVQELKKEDQINSQRIKVSVARIAKLWALLHLAAKWGQAWSTYSGWDTSKKNQGIEGNAVDGTLPCMSNTPAGVLGSCVVGDVFFGWNIKTTNPQALVIKEPVVLSTRAGVFNPLSWLKASRQLLSEIASPPLQSHFCFLSKVTTSHG